MKRLFAAAVLCLPLGAFADAARTGSAIAGALNEHDIEATMRLIDTDATTRLVFRGLNLTTKDRDALRMQLPNAMRTSLSISVKTIEVSKGTARFMRTGSRDGKPFALVRFELGDNGIEYVEYYLTATDKVEDWFMHSNATLYSESVRLGLATMLKTDSMLYSLLGSRMTTKADAKPFNDLRAQLQAQDFKGAYKTLESFPEDYRKTRQWALMRVTYAGRFDEATHRAALRYLSENFGTDPQLQFMLVDHHIFEQRFDKALAGIRALERTVGGEDAATATLRGNVTTMMERFDEAAKICRHAISLERDYKPAYWCLVGVGLNQKNGKLAVEGLKAYEKAFTVQFNLDQLAAMAEYKQIATTPEFAAWRKSRR